MVRVELFQLLKFTAPFPVHHLSGEPAKGCHEIRLGVVGLDPQVSSNVRRPDHRTRHVGLVYEDHSLAVCVGERFEDTPGFFADAEVVPEKL